MTTKVTIQFIKTEDLGINVINILILADSFKIQRDRLRIRDNGLNKTQPNKYRLSRLFELNVLSPAIDKRPLKKRNFTTNCDSTVLGIFTLSDPKFEFNNGHGTTRL